MPERTRTANPRASNTGVTPPSPGRVAQQVEEIFTGLGSRFDWYEWTADGLDDGRVAAHLAVALGATTVPAKGRNGYGRAESVQRGDDVLATVYGGSSRNGEVHVSITGAACDQGVPVCRRLWTHRVSRADVALDFVADFEELNHQLVAFATARGLRHETIRNSEGGATTYVGGRTSEVRLRLYKKTEQLIALHPEAVATIPPGIVRIEVQTRPGKRATKEIAGMLRPDDFFGLAQWSTDYAAAVLRLDPVRTATHFRQPSDWTRAAHYLGLQWSPAIERRVEQVGLESARDEVFRVLGLS